MATLTVTATTSFVGQALTNIDRIDSTGNGARTATFAASQFGPGEISNNLVVVSTGATFDIVILNASGTFSAAGWTLSGFDGASKVTITGGKFADNLTGSSGRDSISGGIGNDTIAGGLGSDTLNGGSGNDRFVYGGLGLFGPNEVVRGGDGIDSMVFSGGQYLMTNGLDIAEVERIEFAAGADVRAFFSQVSAASGMTEVQGSDGADILQVFGASIDLSHLTMTNWSAADALLFVATASGGSAVGTSAGDSVELSPASGFNFASVQTGGGDDRLLLKFGGFGTVAIDGGDGFDRVVMPDGSGIGAIDFSVADLTGIEAVDFGNNVVGPAILSRALVSAGLSTFIGNSSENVVQVLMTPGFALDLSGVTLQTWTGLDRVEVDGTAFADTITGTSGRDGLEGGEGADTLAGGDGFDSLLGGVGDDVLEGGAGGDSLDGGDGSDTVTYQTSAAAVAINLGAGTASGGDAAGDTLSAIEHINASNKADSVIGDDGFNRLRGLGGTDFLAGGNGRDTLEGGNGRDTLDGDVGIDRLIGGGGRDSLTGGGDSDFFVYLKLSDSRPTNARDRIADFTPGQDRIDVAAIDAIAGGGDDAFTFNAGGAFTGAGEIRVEKAGANTLVLFNTDADLDAEMSILLTGNLSLSGANFVL